MQAFKIIIGTSGKSYSLTIENNGEYFQMPPKTLDTNDTYFLTLKALLDFIMIVIKNVHEKIELYYYCSNFDVCYEWNNEYLKNNDFNKNTKNIKLWKQITDLLERYNIVLHIKKNNYLNFIGKVNKCN